MIVLPLLWQVPKTFHHKFLFQHQGIIMLISTCLSCLSRLVVLSSTFLPQSSTKRLFHDTSGGTFRIIIAYQETIIASFEDIWQSKLSQNVDRR